MKFNSDEERTAWDGYAKTALMELMAPDNRATQGLAFSFYSDVTKPKSLEAQAAKIADGLLKMRRAREKS